MHLPAALHTAQLPKAPLLLLFLFSLACTQIPLFNYLGFEFSALTALLASVLAGLATLAIWKRWLREQSAADHEENPRRAEQKLWGFLKRLCVYLALVCLLPAVILALNALFVKNCSLVQGFMVYGLLVVPAVFFAGALALVIAVSGGRWKKTWFVLIVLVLLSDMFLTTVTRPQIFAFNPIVGYFPGFTYDETLQIQARLLLYRWATVCATLLLLILAVAIYRWRTARHASHPQVVREVIIGSLLALTVGVVFFFSDELGLSSSVASIERELGGKIETEHVVLVYPVRAVDETQARRLALLHEFYFTTLAQELRVVSVRKIHSFLYATPEQKGRLIGAAQTNIAKPWLWQIHLNLGDVETSLKHELVHVMAAEFGFPLLRVGLNPGLIEGLAVAVERVQFDETIHRVAAQILSLNLPIDAQRLFSIVGFARTHPRVSYALAGSFCRFLIDHYGLRRFKRLYRTGDFRDVYQKEMSALLAEWRRQLDRYRVGDEERLKAAALFKRPTLFGKECVRVIANLNAQTQSLYDKGDYEGALQSATLSLQFTISGEAVFLKMNSLLRLGEFHAAEEFAVQMLRDSTWGATLLALKLQLGDAQWAGGNPAQAERTYSELLRTHFSPTMDESLLLRLEVLRDRTLSSVLVPYFVGALPDSSRLALLHTAAERSTRTELMSYLLAREYAAQGKDRRAIELFRRFEKMPSDELELQRQLRVARLEYARGEFQRAKIHFWQSMNYTSSAALQVRIQEWLDRCDWMTNPPPVLSEQKHGELLSSRPEGERYRELIFAHFLDTFCHASATDIPEHNLDSPQFTNGALLQTDSSQLVGGHHENND